MVFVIDDIGQATITLSDAPPVEQGIPMAVLGAVAGAGVLYMLVKGK